MYCTMRALVPSPYNVYRRYALFTRTKFTEFGFMLILSESMSAEREIKGTVAIYANWSVEDKTGHFWCLIDYK